MSEQYDHFMMRSVNNLSVVKMAEEVLRMADQINLLQQEVRDLRHYREEHIRTLHESIEHNHSMLGGLLNLAMTPGVLEATIKAAHEREAGDD